MTETDAAVGFFAAGVPSPDAVSLRRSSPTLLFFAATMRASVDSVRIPSPASLTRFSATGPFPPAVPSLGHAAIPGGALAGELGKLPVEVAGGLGSLTGLAAWSSSSLSNDGAGRSFCARAGVRSSAAACRARLLAPEWNMLLVREEEHLYTSHLVYTRGSKLQFCRSGLHLP